MQLDQKRIRRISLARLSAILLAMAALATGYACVQNSGKPDPFAGPSELALSIVMTASPDVLPLDGAAQSLVTIMARDSNGNPVVDVMLTLQIVANGIYQDFGQLSARSLPTGSDGRAVVTYTAPVTSANEAGEPDLGTVVSINATPTGQDADSSNFANALPRSVSIRLVPPGTVIPLFDATPGFEFTPNAPTVFDQVRFSAPFCVAGATDTTICTQDPYGVVTTFDWAFGDGLTATGPEVTHADAIAGTYTVTLTIGDPYNRSESTTRTVSVSAGTPPTAVITVSPGSPNIEETVFFSASTSTAGTGQRIVSYAWDFGDGSTATGENLSHVYTEPLTHTVTLTVTDDKGQVGTATEAVTVATTAPTSVFTFTPTVPAVNETIFFNATASTAARGRTIVNYKWFFGDGTDSSLGSRVTKVYSAPDTYVVRLTVTDSLGETGTSTQNVTVGGSGSVPSAVFTVSPSAATTTQLPVVDASASTPSPGATGIETYVLDWGDGTALQTSTIAAPSREPAVYAAAGIYTVTLTITDSLSNSDTASTTLTVN